MSPTQLSLGLDAGSPLGLPAQPEPMRARPVSEPFDSPDYLFETRWNGIRALASIAGGKARLHNRRQGDLSARFPELRMLCQAVSEQPLLVDGEIVIVDDRGHPDFAAAQRRLRLVDEQLIGAEALRRPACFLASDVLFRGRRWLVGEPLQRRKQVLAEALHQADCLYLAEYFEGEGRTLFQAAIESDLEGILAKPKDSLYAAGTGGGWLQVGREREELAIGGYSMQIAEGVRFVELQLGGYDQAGRFVFATTSPPPKDERSRNELFALLNTLQIEQAPFVEPPPFIACWVRPEVVATVRFGGQQRQPVLERVRLDVAPDECLLPVDAPGPSATAPALQPRLTMLTTLPLPLGRPAEASARPALRLLEGPDRRMTGR